MGWGVNNAGGGGSGSCGSGVFWGWREAWIVFLVLILLLMGTMGGFCGI
jgi:hypothetical protein